MIDIDALQKDPRFLSRSPEARQALLAKAQAENAVPMPSSAPQQSAYQRSTQPLVNALGTLTTPNLGLGQTGRAFAPMARQNMRSLVGNTPTQGAINAASLATIPLGGEGILGALGRTAAVGAAGAGGAALEGKSPLGGAAQGVLQQGAGEALAPVANLFGRYSKSTVNKLMTSDVGQWVSQQVPALGKFGLKDSLGFSRALRTKQGLDHVENTVRKPMEEATRKVAANHLIDMPSLHSGLSSGPYRIPFDDALKAIRKLDDASSWTINDDTAARLLAKNNRRMAFAARQDLSNGLNNIRPGLGDQFMAAQKQYATARVLRDVFKSSKDLFPAKGGVDWAAVKQLVDNTGTEGYGDELARQLGPDGVEELQTVLGRGELTTKGDIKGGMSLSPSIGVHGVHAFVHPHLGQTIGKVPRRIPKIPPAIPGFAAANSINDFIQSLQSDQNATDQEGP